MMHDGRRDSFQQFHEHPILDVPPMALDEHLADMLPPDINPGDTLYVVDHMLKVVYTSDRWAAFAASNNGERVLEASWNPRVLENLTGREHEKWKHVYRLLLEGRLPLYSESFNASGPFDRRIYDLRVIPRRDASGAIRWLVHHTRQRDEKQNLLQRQRGMLDSLKSPRHIIREYHQRVMDRPINVRPFRAAQYFQPLEEVGGDVLWSCELPDGSTFLLHADVMGHGLEAAELGTKLVVLLDELLQTETDIGEICQRLNRAMVDMGDGENVTFATGLLFKFVPEQSELRALNFGHHGPIFSRSGLVQIKGGLPVGIVDSNEPWPQTVIDLDEHGSRFLIFSDGILEQFDQKGQPFGYDGLVNTFREHLHLPLQAMVERIVADVATYRGTALIKDDQTLLALELMHDDRVS
ncbi:MAG: PP2C family protein-serine/threonine phosphatase [Phycisphaeraceae bacterium]